MQIYRAVGHVTLCLKHPSFAGARLLLAQPIGARLLQPQLEDDGEMIAVWDQLGASPGDLIAVSDGAEAAQVFRPQIKPVDAYCAAIIDQLEIDPLTE